MDELKVTAIQAPLHWESIEANLAMFEEKIWQIEGAQDLIILPEMFTTGFTMNASALAEPANSKTFRWMKQQAAQTKAVVMGSYIIKESGQYFNRLYAVYPDGQSSYYDKRHLFALAGEDQNYQRGTERCVIIIKGWKVMPLICYDLRFPVWARSRSANANSYEYDLLVVVANWPQKRMHAWDTLLAARAIENSAYAIGVNRVGDDENGVAYVGHSAVYDYLGSQCCFSNKESILSYTFNRQPLEEYRENFPFQGDQDGFQLLD